MCLDATKPTEPTQLASLPIRELSSIQYPILSNPVTLVLVTNLEFALTLVYFLDFIILLNYYYYYYYCCL